MTLRLLAVGLAAALAACGSQAQLPVTVTVSATLRAPATPSPSPTPTRFYIAMSSDSAIGHATAYIDTQSRAALDWFLGQDGSNGYQVRQVSGIPSGLAKVCTGSLTSSKGEVSAWADENSAAGTFLANIACSG